MQYLTRCIDIFKKGISSYFLAMCFNYFRALSFLLHLGKYLTSGYLDDRRSLRCIVDLIHFIGDGKHRLKDSWQLSHHQVTPFPIFYHHIFSLKLLLQLYDSRLVAFSDMLRGLHLFSLLAWYFGVCVTSLFLCRFDDRNFMSIRDILVIISRSRLDARSLFHT